VFAAIGIVLVGVQGGLVGPITHRLGEGGTLRFGLLSNAAGLGLLSIDFGWPGLIVSLLLLTVGQGLLTPTLSSAIAGRAGRQTGQWLGWQQSAGGLARVIGPIVAGSLFQFMGVGTPYALGAALALLALLLLPSGSKRAKPVTAG
jgi:MFS family permease